MEETPTLIADLALILISAGLTTIIFKWLKQPVILGYIVAGFLVGKQMNLTPTVGDSDTVGTWADIGVVFLMFGLGLEFSFKKLLKVGRSALTSAAVIIPGMIVLGTIVGLLMGWSLTNSMLLGGMISMSSTMIIMKAFDDMDLRSQKFTQLVLGILIFEDLIAILLMVIISTTAVSKSLDGVAFVMALGKLAFFMIVWMLCGIFFIPTFLKHIKAKQILNDETLLIIAAGMCFCMVIGAESVGFSSELGAFVMGSIFAETVEAERIDSIMKPLKDLFGAIFFVSVGMLIDVSVIGDYALQIIIISLTVICGQIFFASCGLLLSGQNLKTAIQSGFSLTQVGEFAFIIALLGTNLGMLDKFVYPVIVAVSVITIFITPFLMKLSLPAYSWLEVHLPRTWRFLLDRNASGESSSAHNENVWQSLLKQIAKIVAIYSSLVVAVLIVYRKYLAPIAAQHGVWVQTGVAVVALLILSPFLRAIVAKKNHSREYKFLWASKKSNWAPLIMLSVMRVLLAVSFIFFLLASTYDAKTGMLFAVATIIIMAMYASRNIKMQSIRIERRFFLNLNQREYEEELKEQNRAFRSQKLSNKLSTYDLHLTDFEVSADSVCCGKSLIELDFRRKYMVHVVSIIRGRHRVNIPGGKELIFPGDKVLVLGTDTQLAAVKPVFGASAEADDVQNNEVGLEQFEVEKDSHLVGKTIMESGIRDNSKCLVVGIERGAESMMNPDVRTVFEVGDIVWIVGEKEQIAHLASDESISVIQAT